MSLRRPAAQEWRRSGDEWESLMSKGERSPHSSYSRRAPRPQSAVEGGRLDNWLDHLRTMQNKVRVSAHDQSFNDRTLSMPVLDGEPSGQAWRQMGFPSFSRGSSSCGSSSLCESSPDSQESFQTGLFSHPNRRGSWEKAYITQTPTKEQAQLSYLAPVKIGWLPIQRRVMMVTDAGGHNQPSDHSPGQMKLKQPITPAFQRNHATPRDGEVERSHNNLSPFCVKTCPIPDQRPSQFKEVADKLSSPANKWDGSVSWQALRKGWTGFPGGNKLNESFTEPNKNFPLVKQTSDAPIKHSPLRRTTSADPAGRLTTREENVTTSHKSHTLLHRTRSCQPIKPTTFLNPTDDDIRSTQPQTTSAVTTLIPQNKAGFTSITISSRKVSRSTSLPGSDSFSQSRQSPSSTPDHMDPNSRPVTLQRKATIIKVTEKRVLASPGPHTETALASNALDTVVRRRKATIIKVTEHKESYTPSKFAPRHPEYRYSYTEGVNEEGSTQSQAKKEALSFHCLSSTQNSAITPKAFPMTPDKQGTPHKSSLSLFVSFPATAAPSSQEVSPRAVGQRSDGLHRPLSCYGDLIGHAEPSEDNVAQTAARKWSFGLPQETNINPVTSERGVISPEKAGQLMADTLKPNREEQEKLPPSVDGMRRASPSLTLIKAPDPYSRQSQEEVLAHNVAAIIANIKFQRQLSKQTTPIGRPEKSAASPQGHTDIKKCANSVSEQSKVQSSSKLHKKPNAAFVTPKQDHERSAGLISLQQALERSRPDFIIRSKDRVQALERKMEERRDRLRSGKPRGGHSLKHGGPHAPQFTSMNGCTHKSSDTDFSRKEMTSRYKQ